MNCRRARHLLFDFFDGASNEALRAEVDRHLGECADCEQYALEMTRSLALLRRAPVEPLDENFNWKVRLAIHRERNAAVSRAQSAGAWVRMWNVRYAVSSTLAFGAVLVAGALLLRDGNVVSPERVAPPTTAMTQSAGPIRPRPVPQSNVATTGRNDVGPRLVSTGETNGIHINAPQGAIDKTLAEQKFDSLLTAEAMRMSEQQRELYFQRRIERIQQLRQHFQSQQAAPAQR